MAQDKTLLEETLSLLDKDKRSLMELSKDSGLGYFWLRAVKRREIPNPGIIFIEKLYAVLKASN